MKRVLFWISSFRVPLFVLLGIFVYLFLEWIHVPLIANIVIWFVIGLGSVDLIRETVSSLWYRKFALDYIAIVAILVGIFTQEYLVAAIIVLMLSGGTTLEEYGVNQAKRSLTSLIDRLPQRIGLWRDGSVVDTVHISKVDVGQQVLIRKGEVVPLDGVLSSEAAVMDESSLTGEPYMIEKRRGDVIRSGTANLGEAIVVRVVHRDEDSAYRKIIQMVRDAQKEKAPLVRLADKYSTVFTIVTFVLSGFAYMLSGQFERILAVLVMATPCPLLLATPIALMGGVNASARRRIIVKNLSSLEVMARVKAIVFDKTGTITLGRPKMVKIEVIESGYNEDQVTGIAAAIEHNSLHPIAKAFIDWSKRKHIALPGAQNVEEKIGSGISGDVDGKRYRLSGLQHEKGLLIVLYEGERECARFYFEDMIKHESKSILRRLIARGTQIFIFTGDKKEAAMHVQEQLGLTDVQVMSEMTPEQKKDGIDDLKKRGLVTAMIGDGINDAPALASADVGMVFSHEEHTAASEAADVVFLGGDFSLVLTAFSVAQRSVGIALQSIWWGIGLSVLGMVLASFGLVPPIVGAFLQEVIDVAVILNAVRASR